MKSWLYPTGVERDYLAAIRRVQIKPLEQAIKDNILPILPNVLAAGARQDAPTPSWFDTVRDAFETTLRQANVPEAELRRIVERVSGGVDGFNRKEFNAVLKSVYRVDVITRSPPALQAALGVFEAQNIALIKSIPVQSLATLQGEIIEAVRTGQTLKDTQALIRNRYGVTDRRAKLIARDQVGKLNGQLTRLRQEEIGVTEYTWRGILDARERPEHVAREGKVFAWDKPPPDGSPGQPINCRCSASPVLPTFEELEERLTGQRPPEGTYQPPASAPAPRPVPAPVPPSPAPLQTPRAPTPARPLEDAVPKRPIEPVTPPVPVPQPVPSPRSPIRTESAAPLTPTDQEYLDYYKSGGQIAMTQVLRNPGAYTPTQVVAAQTMQAAVNRAARKGLVTKPGVVYRGARDSVLYDLASALVGGTVPVKTAQSASTSKGSALAWLNGFVGGVVLRITIERGSAALGVAGIANAEPDQEELLLPAGGAYRVEAVRNFTDASGVSRRYVDVTLVDDVAAASTAASAAGEGPAPADDPQRQAARVNLNVYEIEDMLRVAREQEEKRTGLR